MHACLNNIYVCTGGLSTTFITTPNSKHVSCVLAYEIT